MRAPGAIVLALLLPAIAAAQQAMSQSRMEDDCLQRLRPIVPQGVKSAAVGFSALGNWGTYFVVSVRFSGTLANGERSATCTYRQGGQWVRDDAHAYRLARELEPARPRNAGQ